MTIDFYAGYRFNEPTMAFYSIADAQAAAGVISKGIAVFPVLENHTAR